MNRPLTPRATPSSGLSLPDSSLSRYLQIPMVDALPGRFAQAFGGGDRFAIGGLQQVLKAALGEIREGFP